MTRVRIIMMALVAVLCLGAVTASGAYAAKGEIVKAGGGSLTKTHVRATSGETTLTSTSGSNIKCKRDTIEGEVLSRTSLTFTVSFFGCKSSLASACKGGNAGPASAELITIGGLLLDVVFAPGSGTVLLSLIRLPGTISFVCGTVTQEVRGGFLAKIEPLNTAKTLFLVTSKQTSAGVQELTEYEATVGGGVKEAILESNLAKEGFKQSSQVGTEDMLFEESVEFV